MPQDNTKPSQERICWAILAALNSNGRMTYGEIFGAVDADLFNGDSGEELDDILEPAIDVLVTTGVVGFADNDDGPFRRYFMLPEYNAPAPEYGDDPEDPEPPMTERERDQLIAHIVELLTIAAPTGLTFERLLIALNRMLGTLSTGDYCEAIGTAISRGQITREIGTGYYRALNPFEQFDNGNNN